MPHGSFGDAQEALGRYVKMRSAGPGTEPWITKRIWPRQASGRVNEVTPRFVPLSEIMKRKFGNPAPVEFFCELIKEFGPTEAFVLMVTGRGQENAEVFLVEQP
jgi:hypothetical protein